MTKEEYMEKLAEALREYNISTRNEILEDYESHFAEGRAAGLEDSQIIAELGNIEDMIAEIPDEYKHDTSVAVIHPEREENEEYYGFGGEHVINGVVISSVDVDIVAERSNDDRFYLYYNGFDDDDEYQFFQEEKDGMLYAGLKRPAMGLGHSFFAAGNFLWKIFDKYFGNGGNTADNGSDTSNVAEKSYYPVRAEDADKYGDEKKIIIYVPDGMNHVEIKNVSGHTDVTDISAKELIVTSVSGPVMMNSLSAGSISVRTTSGSISLGNSKADSVNLNSVSGAIATDVVSCVEFKSNSVSGRIENHVCVSNYSCGTTSGSIKTEIHGDFKSVSNQSVSGSVMVFLCDKTEFRYYFSSVSGSIKVLAGGQTVTGRRKLSGGTGDREIKATTVSGNIDIE